MTVTDQNYIHEKIKSKLTSCHATLLPFNSEPFGLPITYLKT